MSYDGGMKVAKAGVVSLSLVLFACHSPGIYGHAANYAALDDENHALAGSREFDPVVYDRQREEWRKGTVNLFGVVEARSPGPGGAALLKLSVRRLEPRNICQSAKDEDTCFVTVSDKDFGVVYTLVSLPGGDDTGPHAVGAKSLVRVVGTFGQEVNPTDGAPILHATYYRHWPVFFFVTRESAQVRQ